MLKPEELSNHIQNTPNEHILQTRYDICEETDPNFSPFIHNRSTIFNCTSTICHVEAYTTFVLNIIKYYCSNTFCYMIYKYIYEKLQPTVVISTNELNIISIIHLFRIITEYSVNLNSKYLDIFKPPPFDISIKPGTPLRILYNKMFATLDVRTELNLNVDTLNAIIYKYTPRIPATLSSSSFQYTQPIVLKASLNEGASEVNLHSFTITILDRYTMIISGANGAARGICSVNQDNRISISKFKKYLKVIQNIRRTPTPTLIDKYNKLYNEIFLKNFIIRNVYDETGITMEQYVLIIIGIYNYIRDNYTPQPVSVREHYTQYLEYLQYLTTDLQITDDPYMKQLGQIIIRDIPDMIDALQDTPHTKKIREHSNSDSDNSDSDMETDDDDDMRREEARMIFEYITQEHADKFNNKSMKDVIVDIIYNILDCDGIPEYFLIHQMDTKYMPSTKEYQQFKHDQLNVLTTNTDINVHILGITGSCNKDMTDRIRVTNEYIYDMYQNLGNIFIRNSREEPLISANIILIYILNKYCTALVKGGYYEEMKEFINTYLEENKRISYTKFNVYEPLVQKISNTPSPSSSLSLTPPLITDSNPEVTTRISLKRKCKKSGGGRKTKTCKQFTKQKKQKRKTTNKKR